MRTFLIPTLALFMLMSVAAAPTQASLLYVANSNSFGQIDTTTRVYTTIASGTQFSTFRGNLAYNPGNDTFYGGAFIAGGPSRADTNLLTITRAGVVSASYGSAGDQLSGLSFGPGGTLSAITFSDTILQTINPADGTRTNIGALDVGPGFPGGAVYAGSYLYTAATNPETFEFALMALTEPATSVAYSVVADNSLFSQMLLASDGTTIYGIPAQNTTELYQINPGTGAMNDLGAITGGISNQIYGIAYAPTTAVPEPSTYVLLVISLGVVGYARKRMVKCEE